jgi:hypothetical protein
MASVSELIFKRQNDVSKGWQSFLQQQHLHRSIGVVVEREKTNLPAKFVPWAPGIVIAGHYLLHAAGQHVSQMWRRHQRYGYYYRATLVVRERSGFWFVEYEGNILVFRYGSMPICTRTHHEAINLWEFIFHQWDRLDPPIGPRGHGLRWVKSRPDGILDC